MNVVPRLNCGQGVGAMGTTGISAKSNQSDQRKNIAIKEHRLCDPLIQAGVDVYTVQKLGRWKTISMVLRYAHHQPESLRGGAEVLDRLRRENSTKLAQWGATPSVGAA